MNFLYRSEVINYDYYFNDKADTIVFLHGWGGDKNSFSSTIKLLQNDYNILTLTLPTIQETVLNFTLNEYTDIVMSLLKLLNVDKPIIICHSFGFRICAILNVRGVQIKKLIVTGGAGPRKKIDPITKLNSENNRAILQNKKYKYLYKKIASPDYQMLSGNNKATFKNVVNLNTKNFIHFKIPVLLFWGKKDKDTRPWIAKQIKKQNDAELIFINAGTHFAYLTHNSFFNNSVVRFLRS